MNHTVTVSSVAERGPHFHHLMLLTSFAVTVVSVITTRKLKVYG